MEQLDLLAGIKIPPKKMPEGEKSEDYLERGTKDQKELMVFVIGGNPHLCSVRFHSKEDPEGKRWINRKDAERILEKNKYKHFYNVHNGNVPTKVYRS